MSSIGPGRRADPARYLGGRGRRSTRYPDGLASLARSSADGGRPTWLARASGGKKPNTVSISNATSPPDGPPSSVQVPPKDSMIMSPSREMSRSSTLVLDRASAPGDRRSVTRLGRRRDVGRALLGAEIGTSAWVRAHHRLVNSPADPGVTVTFAGSGDAFGSGGRYQTCIHLRERHRPPVLLDCGATSLTALRSVGPDPGEIGTVLVSHSHGDHFGGLPFLILNGHTAVIPPGPMP